ncbi:MAG TPA: (5-formylfuran-3-yl)methyl phosphate synthase [Gemmatimonadaceae bacterium]|nr:(5-formylfuran-3-yl)methyl phosphate synthase [Gemmatimonadaceae bacterium]
MRLLISVSSGAEAEAALEGGADIIDAKDPAAGPLGAVSGRALGEIVRAVDGRLPVSAALGDASDEVAVALAARRVATHRLAYLKIGFAGISDQERVESLVAAAVHGACLVSASIGVIAVGYADYLHPDVASLSPWWLVEAAERAGALGVLLDTAVKHTDRAARGVFGAMSETQLAAWVRHAHGAELTVAVAGGLAGSQLSELRALGVDVAGVRGAACEDGDRLGRVSRARVAALARCAGRRSWAQGPAPASRLRRGGEERLEPSTSPAALQ